jgi:hypothetical protein
MSFLYDPNIYIQLIKQSQVVAPPRADTNNISLAKKLVNRLSRELANVPEPPNLTTSSPNSNLMVGNLKNLSELLKFIDTNQLMIDGKRIAYDSNEASKLSQDILDKLSKVTIDVSRNPDADNDPNARKWNTDDYWTDMDLLIKYVAYLQQKAKTMQENNNSSGKVLEVMVGKIIDQINAYNPKSGLTRKPKSKPGQPNTLPDDFFIDGLDPKIFDESAAISVNRNASDPLLAKDLKTRNALNAWLNNSKVVSVDTKGVKTTLDYSDEKSDTCVIFRVLYKRAKYLKSKAANDDQEKASNYYLKQIEELAPTFEFNGKACNLGASSTSGTNTGAGGASGTGAGGSEAIKKVIQLLPLRVDNIDFNRIDAFCRQYEMITAHPGTKATITELTSLMNEVQGSLLKNANQSVFALGASPQEVVSWIKPQPPAKFYGTLLEKLSEIVSKTEDVITDLKISYIDVDPGSNRPAPSYAAYVYGQIGKTPTDNSFARRNKDDLARLKSQVRSVNTVGNQK